MRADSAEPEFACAMLEQMRIKDERSALSFLREMGGGGQDWEAREANMKGRLSDRLSIVLVAACAVFLGTVGITLAAGTWVDEITNSLTFYKANYPNSNFDPYFERLARMRDGLAREDQQIVNVETDQFLKMLLTRAHGINDVAADELYNFALSVRPADQQNTSAAIGVIEIGVGTERPMAVPDHLANTRDDGRTPCVGFKDGGCDYWIDFMDDNSGG